MKYFAFDLETVSTDVVNGEPVQIGVTLVDSDGTYEPIRSHYVATEVPMTDGALKVHGIGPEIYMKGWKPSKVVEAVERFIKKNNVEGIIAFNGIRFDVPMLQNFIKRHGGSFDLWSLQIDDPAIWYLADKIYKCERPKNNQESKAIAQRYIPKGTKFNLKYVSSEFGVNLVNAHAASADIEATIEVWKKMKLN
jgi:DNA polymerase III epsilon subunit-like protein